MKDESSLVPVDERSVDFYGDEIVAALVRTEQQQTVAYVPLRPICGYLGLSWSGQRERITRDAVLSQEAKGVRVTRTPGSEGIRAGGGQIMLCLPLDLLNGWLFGVNAARVKPELREKLIRYQRECYRILWQAFQAEAATVVDAVDPAQASSLAALEQIREMGLAIVRMAEQQIEMELRLNARLDRAAKVVGDLQRRLGVVERKLTPSTLITDEQAEEVSAAVKALAEFMTGKDASKNHYQGIFAELYRRFGVSSYKHIRLDQYGRVVQFLEDWYQSAEKQ